MVRQVRGPEGGRPPVGKPRRVASAQKLKHFVTDTLNFEAYAHLITTIFATVTAYSAALSLI